MNSKRQESYGFNMVPHMNQGTYTSYPPKKFLLGGGKKKPLGGGKKKNLGVRIFLWSGSFHCRSITFKLIWLNLSFFNTYIVQQHICWIRSKMFN